MVGVLESEPRPPIRLAGKQHGRAVRSYPAVLPTMLSRLLMANQQRQETCQPALAGTNYVPTTIDQFCFNAGATMCR
jgi:hypothetical protein